MNALVLLFLLPFSFCLEACSIPNLEPPDCSTARDVARQYYSLAIGGEPTSRPDVVAKLNALRSPTFSVVPTPEQGRDQFHFSRLQPTSYRVGECRVLPDGRVQVEATVIWRIEKKNSERMDLITLTKSESVWLIDRVDVGQQPGPEF